MTQSDHAFTPTRTAALAQLQTFLPHAGRDYAARRNFDLGAGRHTGVSTLSPYIRTRLLTEADVLTAVLGRFALSSAEKFVQEVYWRTYWKGWLELRPSVWDAYQAELAQDWNHVQTQGGLRRDWEAACLGETGIDCFDHWAKELAATGYLHNHARMWFASIWIFTLRLPWTLGADFFLRHLLDGDPASNTLSWRWVAGIQTEGKTYLARASNISKFTEGRFNPRGLAKEAPALRAQPRPAPRPLPMPTEIDPALRTGVVMHTDDLTGLPHKPRDVTATAVLRVEQQLSPLAVSDHISTFLDGACVDAQMRHAPDTPWTTLQSAQDLSAWIAEHDLEQVVLSYPPVGPVAATVTAAERESSARFVRLMRPYDAAAWPYATHGFFKFKDKIPKLVAQLNGIGLAAQ